MGLGILETRSRGHVPGGSLQAFVHNNVQRRSTDKHAPGTATLDEILQTTNVASDDSSLKRSSGANPVILIPQPSDDPNDPLNWPLWRRDIITAILSLLSVLASTLSPLLAADTLTLVLHFRKPFTSIALLTGYHLLGVGLAGFLFVPSARVWGKRHLYILGTVIIIISSIWGGASGKNYKSLLAARVFQGVGLAPFEALVNVTVGDLYFVHERGKRMALSNLSLFGGAFFTPVIVGKMTSTLGWEWTFYFCAIFTGLLLPLVYFFVPETTFNRADHLNTDSSRHELREHYKTAPESSIADVHAVAHSKRPLVFGLALFNGRHTDESYFKLLLRPFPLFFHPGILWACLIQGALIGWTVLIGIVLAAIMLGPPLFFNEVQTGYMYTGAFIGAVLGFIIAGLISDPCIKLLTRWNKGVYEPEFRLVLVLPQLVFGCAGLYGFGITANDTTRYGWVRLLFHSLCFSSMSAHKIPVLA